MMHGRKNKILKILSTEILSFVYCSDIQSQIILMFCHSYFIFFITAIKPSITFTIHKPGINISLFAYSPRQLNAYSDLHLTPLLHMLEKILSIISLISKF